MCGICGIINKGRINNSDIENVRLMNSKLSHRGPDDEGIYYDDSVCLAMKRLSIIDLEGGKQPLFNEDNTIVLVVNGEIYNYVELKQELETQGHLFKTNTDSETIIHAYELYNDNFISYLRGMFAFCLYDKNRKKVIIARDRMSEKPLYIYEDKNGIYFSSEMKSLITILEKDKREINYNNLLLYFYYQYIPEPLTLIKNIRKLPAAHNMEINLNGNFASKTKQYWSIDDIEPYSANPSEVILDALNDIERIIIRADVPIGVSLSSGIDSSLIALLASKYYNRQIHAFSVGYPRHQKNDERKEAKRFADKLGMIFHDIEIKPDDFIKDFDNMIYYMDDPIADIAAYGHYSVSKRAYNEGVPVLLVGFGGDELFWGYPWMVKIVEMNRIKKTDSINKIRYLSKQILQSSISIRKMKYFYSVWQALKNNNFIFYDFRPKFTIITNNIKQIFSKDFLAIVNNDLPFNLFHNNTLENPEITACKLINELWLFPNCVVLGDRMSMAHSIEMRLPLLDYRLVETVYGLRKHFIDDYKLGHKHWLIESIKDLLPEDILRLKKRGFNPPVIEWQKTLINKNRSALLDGYLISNNILNKVFINKLFKKIDEYCDFLYKCILIEVWLKFYL